MEYRKLLDLSDGWLTYAIRLNLCHEPEEGLAELKKVALADSRIQGFARDVANFHGMPVTNHKNPDLPRSCQLVIGDYEAREARELKAREYSVW